MSARLLLFVVLGTGAGCSDVEVPAPGMQISVTRLRTDGGTFLYYSQIRQRERLVIRDVEAWHAAWASLWPNGAPIPAPPTVDFQREMIVMAALGERATGGYGISVDSARMTATGPTVWVGTSSPGPHCGTTQALTQPVDIARLPRIDSAVHFIDVGKVVDCQ